MAFKIIENIKTAFKARLDELEWIGDEATRVSIKAKIENGIQLFGYPDYIFNHTELDQFYDEFVVTENDYFENQVSATIPKYLFYPTSCLEAKLPFQSLPYPLHIEG